MRQLFLILHAHMHTKLNTLGFRPMLCAVFLQLSFAASAQNLLGSPTVRSDQVTANLLLHAPEGVKPGAPVWAALQLQHAKSWHTYWKNPGDSGLPTQLEWTLPPNVQAGDVAWPTPKKFPLGPLANFGYDGTVLLAVPLVIGPDFSAPQLKVGLAATWLACRTECIPEDGQFHLVQPSSSPVSQHGRAFEEATRQLPTRGDGTAMSVQVSGQFLNVEWRQAPRSWQGKSLDFFPETPALIEPGAPWNQTWVGSTWKAKVPLSPIRSDAPTALAVTLANSNVPHGAAAEPGVTFDTAVEGTWPAPLVQLDAKVSDELQAALDANSRPLPVQPTGSGLGLWSALIGALLGGLILNLMPCVFPILAIKVMAFGHHNPAQHGHRKAGVAYTLGVVLSFVLLGATLLSLRAAGEQLGWGFQLQNPAVVSGLAVLFTLIALNLMGVFEVGNFLPSSVSSMQVKSPTTDAFLTGVLTTAIASPCTAPFMGASLGAAITLPTEQALGIFAMLGFGMALPYLGASWMPGLARVLPKPGPWMNTFKQLMAFPMWATVVWLLWVLGQQTGVDGIGALMLILVVLAWWVWAINQKLGLTRRILSTTAAAALGGLLWVAGPTVVREPMGTPTASNTTADTPMWEPWTQAKQAALQTEGRPVFVDFTAAWCVTCQFNKRTALSDIDVQTAFRKANTALLRADWTRRDPAVTLALSQLGRNGVPTYAYFAPGQPPVVLSEVLRASDLTALLAHR